MITRDDVLEHVTIYGAAPVVDPHGYTIEIGDPQHRFLRLARHTRCLVWVSTAAEGRATKLRVDLTAAGVREVIDRLIAWEAAHDASFIRRIAIGAIEWLREHDSDGFASLAFYMQSCLTEGTAK